LQKKSRKAVDITHIMVAKEIAKEAVSLDKVKSDGEAPMAAGDGEEDDVVLPGFRFHPTDEELVTFYLRRKVARKPLSIEIIKEMDIYKHDPWDLPSKCTHMLFQCPLFLVLLTNLLGTHLFPVKKNLDYS
jgi:hypothetical protein